MKYKNLMSDIHIKISTVSANKNTTVTMVSGSRQDR
jgi:hypothetical protein